LKEVEKEYNFYSSTPLKNKLFSKSLNSEENLNLLRSDLLGSSFRTLKEPTKNLDFNFQEMFMKRMKKNIESGETRNNFFSTNFYNFFYNPKTNNTLDASNFEYKLLKNYFTKNAKNPIKGVDELEANANF
jgi:hypothetical protein